jgi:hypothetical protein
VGVADVVSPGSVVAPLGGWLPRLLGRQDVNPTATAMTVAAAVVASDAMLNSARERCRRRVPIRARILGRASGLTST